MSLRRLLAVAGKEYHHVTRDPRTLLLVTVAPAVLLLALAYVFSFDANEFKLVVLDQDQTALSRRYVSELTGDGVFKLVGVLETYDEIDAWLMSGRAAAALVIPPGTESALRAMRRAPVQVIVDGVNSITAVQVVSQLDAHSAAFSLTLIPVTAGGGAVRLQVRSQAWYNPSLKAVNSMVPGLMAVVLTMPVLALAIALTREKELGSFEGIASTPVLGVEYLLGKLLTYLVFGLVGAVLVMLLATFWFNVPFRGNLLSFLALTACYLFGALGVSMMIATFVKSQQAAMMTIILVFFVPSIFLGGLILPIDTTSAVSRAASAVVPATHYITIARGVFLKGLGPLGLRAPVLVLLGLGGVTVALSLALFRKRIE
jgi:ABC-2 type transport system permease protein